MNFDFQKPWPGLEEAKEELIRYQTLSEKQSLTKADYTQLENALTQFHTTIVCPSFILENTPDLFKVEFKEWATALASEYLCFCLDVLSNDAATEKVQYL